MASPALSARLRYLNDSAHLLVSTAPVTSKYMMSQCNSLMFEHNLEQSESQKRNVCGACGTIMILGWHGTLEVESQRFRRRNKGRLEQRPRGETTRAMVYTCGSCGRKTKQRLNIPAPVTRRKSQLPQAGPLSSMRHPSTPSTAPSANASSKKRAKTRKQGGLEAILAKYKAAESRGSGFGLDLMDLMKKP